jgi:hypothetical protein
MNWTAKIQNYQKINTYFPLIHNAPAALKNVPSNAIRNANFVLIFMYERNVFQI